MPVQIEDARLKTVLEKVERGERLSFDDGLALYRTADLLAVGYMANLVRERLHGNRTYFNVNRHINPTDVCVASCRLCAFGKHVRDPKAYTMSLEEIWHRAGEGWSEDVTEFHIVGGLHPELTLDWYCEMLRGLKQRFPRVHLKALTMVEIGYLARRASITVRETLERLRDAGMDSLPGGGAEIFIPRRAATSSASTRPTGRRGCAYSARGPPAGPQVQLHDALWPHRERGTPHRPPGAAARVAGRDRRLPDVHPAGVSSRQHRAAHIARRTTGFEDLQGHRGGRLMLDNFAAHQGVLDHARHRGRPRSR